MRTIFHALIALAAFAGTVSAAHVLHVSPAGNDAGSGSAAAPFHTLGEARDAIRKLKHAGALPAGGVEVVLHGGTYYLGQTLVFTAEDSGTADAPIKYIASPHDSVVISGGRRLESEWTSYKNGILQAEVPGAKEGTVDFDQLFLDGQQQHLARYPNFDPNAEHYDGVAADCLSPKRIKTWAHPETAILHALHGSAWGDLHYRVTGVDAKGNAILEGGWQNNRSSNPHGSIRFVENVFEELDAPGEWFFDRTTGTLFFYPPANVDLSKSKIEVAGLKHLIEFRGTRENPVRFVQFIGVTFTHAGRTFLEKYEPLLRTDWAIYRGAAVLIAGAEDCSISDADFENLGGNALFVSGYNRRLAISGSRFVNIGASTVCFVGDVSAVRSPTTWKKGDDWATVDHTPGPKTDDYPADCRISDCLMHHFGTVEKQVAGVEIDMASRITVSHCSIYDCPRAGINIGDGCWGGHLIEFCDVFDTVKETGDHGSFNSWGRDRYWGMTAQGKALADLVAEDPKLPEWDVVEPITLRNSRWRCDHGWDIDLDDGSSNYRIYNNLCLHGGIKNREGFDRIDENNIMVGNSFHPHVWYSKNRGVFRHNIVMTAYRPVMNGDWHADEIDHNLFTDEKDLQVARAKYHTDEHSLAGDPMFIDPEHGDYRVKDSSPALTVGFKNFPMDQFGVVSPRLKAEALTPALSNSPEVRTVKVDPTPRPWLGGTVRNILDLGDRSVYGLPDESGVLVLDAPDGSELKNLGLAKRDVIVRFGKQPIRTVNDLLKASARRPAQEVADLTIVRAQKEQKLK